ncbi:MAG TPA: DNA polymerase III subunit chi [Thermohalobaculum sp.]|nr:DNA polymerase III subunit chi [Thermohalobaculum sp.]
MGEIRFYHLTERPIERALPPMLEKSLARGWRVVVQGTDADRLERLSGALWSREGFLPHGTASDGHGGRQPIWLTAGTDRPNRPNTLFLIDGAEAEHAEMAALDMVAIVFNGADDDAVATARVQWRAVTAAGVKAVYWAETPDGGWVRKAESGGAG